MDLESVTQIARWLFLALGVGVIVWALILRDRSKGRRRCPKCWYDMSATEGMRCPECGREQTSEKRFGRHRWSWRGALVGVLLLVLSYAAHVAPDVKANGWMWAVPRWSIVLVMPLLETPREDVRKQFLINKGWMRARVGTPSDVPDATLREYLLLHLLYDRRYPEYSGWEYALIRDDLLRRYDRGEPVTDLISTIVASAESRVYRDDEILRHLIRRGIEYATRGDTLRVRFDPPGIVIPYDIELNGITVHTLDIRIRRGDDGVIDGGSMGPSLLHYHSEVPVELVGQNRGLVRVVMVKPPEVDTLQILDIPERIEFELHLTELFIEKGYHRGPR